MDKIIMLYVFVVFSLFVDHSPSYLWFFFLFVLLDLLTSELVLFNILMHILLIPHA